MTTDQPRAGGPDATPESGPASGPPSGSGDAHVPTEPEGSSAAVEVAADRPAEPAVPPIGGPGRGMEELPETGGSVPGPRIPGAGTPPPGPAASATPTRPDAAPIPGAGVPPPGPGSRSIAQRGDLPLNGGPGSSRSEVERARMGLSDAELSDAPQEPRPADRAGRRFAPRWLRRRTTASTAPTIGTASVADPASPMSASPTTGMKSTSATAATGTALTSGAPTPGTASTAGTPTGPGQGPRAAGTAGPAQDSQARQDAGVALDDRPPSPADSPPKAGTTPAALDEDTAGGKPADAGTHQPATRRRRTKPLPSDRPPGAPPDPWTAFATTEERTPGRIRRGLRRLGRMAVHEYALATYAALLLAVVMTWPALRYPMHTVPQDVFDPARQAWQVAWAGHILLTDPVQLWQANAFFPERYSFAYGNSLLGYAPAGMIGSGPAAAILRYNLLFVLAHALLALGSYALVRQLGVGRTGAAVAAAAFAYAPWRLAQEGHLDIISAGGIPLALAMLARGHGWSMRRGLRPERRHAGWAAAGWLVAAWQVSLGFSLGLPFAYVLAGIILVVAVAVPIRRWRRPAAGPALGWRLMVTDLLGVLILAGIGALIAIPYFRAPDAAAGTAEIDFFSPPLRGLLIGPAESRIWGGPHAVPRSSLGWPAEMALLPGFVLYALALVGLVFSVWKLWQRLLLVLGLAVAVVLTLGTTFFDGRWTYLPLFGHLPGSFGVRIPGRLVLWVTLLLAVLAAGAVAEFVRRAEHFVAHRTPPWPSPWLRLAMFVPMALVLLESWNATAHPVVPDQPAAMRTVSEPMLVLPTAALGDQTVMLWSTSRFQPIANGAGGFAAAQQAELRQAVATFPDAASVQYLRETGVSTVLLVRSRVAGTPWELSGDIPVEALGIRREDLDDDTVLFRLS